MNAPLQAAAAAGRAAGSKFFDAMKAADQQAAEHRRLAEWQRQVADALGMSEGPGMETGGVWFCEDAEQAAAAAREGVQAVLDSHELRCRIEELEAENASLRMQIEELQWDHKDDKPRVVNGE